MLAGMTLVAVLETLAASSIAIFASTFTGPEIVLSSKYVVFIRDTFDISMLQDTKGLILLSGFLMIGLTMAKNSLKGVLLYAVANFSVGIEAFFGSKLLKGFLSLPYQWHLTKNSADIVYSIEWRKVLGRQFIQPCLKICNSLLMVSILFFILFFVQPLISFMVIFVTGGMSFFLYKIIRKQIDEVAIVAKDYELSINKEATMAVHGIKDVKITQKETPFVKKFLKKAVPLSGIYGSQIFWSQSSTLFLETVGLGMIFAAVFTMLFLLKMSTAYVIGTMAILVVTAWKAMPATNIILGNFTVVRNSLPYISTQIHYLDMIEKNDALNNNESNAGRQPKNVFNCERLFRDHIRFNDVSFAYDNQSREALNGVTFSIARGQTTGIIGTSGAGKSTTVDLLIGLLQVSKGEILVDDKRMDNRLRSQWLKIIGYVPQSPYIYDGTLAENIAFGNDRDRINRDRVWDCCMMASMEDFIHDLPDGIDSAIGERGVKLSGGQQQRVAIARALYNRPQVMIFDEATSSLDTKSEKSIQQTIYSFKGDKTLIIIAHRLNTVENCDSIIWLEKGRVVMQDKADIVLEKYRQHQKRGKTEKSDT